MGYNILIIDYIILYAYTIEAVYELKVALVVDAYLVCFSFNPVYQNKLD